MCKTPGARQDVEYLGGMTDLTLLLDQLVDAESPADDPAGRAAFIELETLRVWCKPGGRADGLELAPFYRPRLRTLKAMYEMDAKARAGGPEELGRVELGVPA